MNLKIWLTKIKIIIMITLLLEHALKDFCLHLLKCLSRSPIPLLEREQYSVQISAIVLQINNYCFMNLEQSKWERPISTHNWQICEQFIITDEKCMCSTNTCMDFKSPKMLYMQNVKQHMTVIFSIMMAKLNLPLPGRLPVPF